MEYSQLYQINIDMHLRPFGDLIKTIFSLEDKYSDMEIILHNADVDLAAKHSWIENPRSMFILLEDAVQGKFKKGSNIQVTILGDYSKEVLKECADKIGNIFGFGNKSSKSQQTL